MATSGSSHLEDIDEKFCQCSICLQQYREPKLLPCLHRYCSDCLKQLIKTNQGITVISCPECRDEVTIPTEGVDGFKTDFYMKNIVEYIQIQKTLQPERLLECCDCSNTVTVEAYCLKCNGLLCKDCHKSHMTQKSLKDHKQHTLSLEDLASKHITVDKFADLKEAPTCQSHLNNLCLAYCRTCNDLPICVSCVQGMHKNHDMNDVKTVATDEREKLQNEVKNLKQYKDRMLKMQQDVERIREDITSNLREGKENLTTMYERDMQTVKKEIKRIEEDYISKQTKIKNNKKSELTQIRKQMEEEIEQIKMKYNNMVDEIEKKSNVTLDNLRKEKGGKIGNSKEQLEMLEREFQRSTNTLTKEQEEGLKKIEKISQQIVVILGQYENLTAAGNSVLETKNDWTAAQYIPIICKAIGPLRDNMKKEFPELDTLSKIGVGFEVKEDKNPQ